MRRPVLDESIDPSRAADGAADPTGWRLVDATRAALAEVIGGRRDIRKFRPDAVPEETLQHARVPGPEGRGRAGGAGRARVALESVVFAERWPGADARAGGGMRREAPGYAEAVNH
jgi:hypothetical protein